MPGFSHDFQHGTDSTNTWSEAQTFSTGVILNPDAVFVFPTSSSVPTISSSGQAIWDSTHEILIIANGSSGRHFIPSEGISGEGTLSTAGALTIVDIHAGSSHAAADGFTDPTSTNIWTAQQTFSIGINLTAGQLIFPATQIASADANTLDDYEEGTFTPTVGDNSLDGTGEGQLYDDQVGRYTKIGNRVFINVSLRTSTLSALTLTEQSRILGLPFTAANPSGGADHSVVVGFAGGISIVAGENIVGRIIPNTAYISMQDWSTSASVSTFLLSQWTSVGDIRLSGVYEV